MAFVSSILPYIQIILAILMVTAIMLQVSEASVGGAFGGSDTFNSSYHTRRGFEKVLFNTTIILAILFAATSLLALIK
jgi:protein translocase SecG subunit